MLFNSDLSTVYAKRASNNRPCSIKNVKDLKGNPTPVEGVGDVPVELHLKNGKEEEMVLRNVLYVPNYEVNLPSVNRCIKFGHKFTFMVKSWSTSRSHRGQWFILSKDYLPRL